MKTLNSVPVPDLGGGSHLNWRTPRRAGGIIMAQVISRVSQTPVAISIPAIIFSVVFSMVIGIVFGLLPSVKAAHLNPIDALRRE